MEHIFLKGNDTEGIEIHCQSDGASINRVTKVILYSFGASTELPDFSEGFLNGVFHYCQVRLNQLNKWSALENRFMEVLKEVIIIESEQAYVNALWEFNKKTETDDTMNDLNN